MLDLAYTKRLILQVSYHINWELVAFVPPHRRMAWTLELGQYYLYLLLSVPLSYEV